MNPVNRVLAIRADALERGDLALARECEAQLDVWGITVPQTTEAAVPDEVAVRPRPRRPAKP